MKRVFILLILTGWASISLAQSPTITVNKLVNGSYGNNIFDQTENILAGQKDTFKIVISEPSSDFSGLFSHSGQLKVFLPDDAGLGLDEAALSFPSAGGQSDISLENDSLSSNKDTLFIDINEDGSSQQDQITITDLIIEFPDDLADGDDFELRAWADFMDTESSDTTMELVTFEYSTPTLNVIPPNSKACPNESANCTLDIDPSGIEYELIKNDAETGIMVEDGDNIDLSYGDVISVRDPGNSVPENGSSNEETIIGSDYFEIINLSFNDSPPSHICQGSPVSFSFNVNGCPPQDSARLFFKAEDSVDYKPVSNDEFSFQGGEFDYTPPDNGYLKVKADYGNVVLKDSVQIKNFYSFKQYALKNKIEINKNQGNINLLDYVYPEYNYNSIDSLPINNVYEDTSGTFAYLTSGNVESGNSYSFGRFNMDYIMNYDDDTIFNPNHPLVTYGDGNQNRVSFTYGKYYPQMNDNDGGYCISTSEADISVSREKISVPKESFCAYDDSAYTVTISKDIGPGAIEVEDGYGYMSSYHGYKIEINENEFIEDGTDTTFNLTPNDFSANMMTPVKISAIAKVEVYETGGCPSQWNGDTIVPNYSVGDRRSYGGGEYECIIEDSTNGTNPAQSDRWEQIGTCDLVHPMPVEYETDTMGFSSCMDDT